MPPILLVTISVTIIMPQVFIAHILARAFLYTRQLPPMIWKTPTILATFGDKIPWRCKTTPTLFGTRSFLPHKWTWMLLATFLPLNPMLPPQTTQVPLLQAIWCTVVHQKAFFLGRFLMAMMSLILAVPNRTIAPGPVTRHHRRIRSQIAPSTLCPPTPTGHLAWLFVLIQT